MKLIVGLGNPGKDYDNTRHNVGFMALDFLVKELGDTSFHNEKKMFADIAEAHIGNEKIMFIKPQTFMNESGKCVRTLLDFYKLTPADIIVVHDDLDITPGTHRTTLSSRPAGHNGVADIIEKIGTQDFFRIRLGIGRPTEVNGSCIPSHDFVLQKFSEAELNNLSDLFPKVKEEIVSFLSR